MKNIFKEPAEPFALFNYSDFLILIIINFILYLFIKKRIIKWTKINKIIFGFFLFIIIPFLSCEIELNNVHHKFEIVDGFNVLYILFKIPFWWMIEIFMIYLINLKTTKFK